MADSSRLEELRRRVQKDPASLAFASLAEEYRRAGSHQEAVRVCREGLRHHPEYHSARVTLGRALLALGQLEPAARELQAVLDAAPENLAACRGLAEISLRLGQHAEALTHLRRALALAPGDAELGRQIEELEQLVSPTPAADAASAVDPAQTADRVWVAGEGPAALPGSSPGTQENPSRERLINYLERWLDVLEAGRQV